MALPSIPQGLIAQTGNGQDYLSWDAVTGATSYTVQRSTDGTTYTTLASPAVPEYLDTAVTLGTQYWYKVSATNGSGTSGYTSAKSLVPAPTAEMSLGQVRLLSQQKADRENSNFVTKPEWNNFINLAMFELYDLLITTYEDYAIAPALSITMDGTTSLYPLPDGSNYDGAEPFYKLNGVDLSLNTASNAYVTVRKFNFIDRNRYVYPNTASAIYGVLNMQYRLLGNKIEFIPTPTSGQGVRIWYTPRLRQLLKDTDLTTIGVSGWLQYVIVRAAKYALDKEESDTGKLDQELLFLKDRIEATAMNRDIGQADTISDVRTTGWGSGGNGFGFNGGGGAW